MGDEFWAEHEFFLRQMSKAAWKYFWFAPRDGVSYVLSAPPLQEVETLAQSGGTVHGVEQPEV